MRGKESWTEKSLRSERIKGEIGQEQSSCAKMKE